MFPSLSLLTTRAGRLTLCEGHPHVLLKGQQSFLGPSFFLQPFLLGVLQNSPLPMACPTMSGQTRAGGSIFMVLSSSSQPG